MTEIDWFPLALSLRVALIATALVVTLGESEWRVFWRVTMPLASRGIIAAAMLAFARALGDFGATLMVAGNIPGRTQTAAVAIFDAAQAGRDNYALVLVLILSGVTLALVYASN